MSTDFKQVKKQFEKSMDKYDKNAAIQDLTASMLMEELSKISAEFENILELGSGTGLLTKRLASHLNYKNLYANDLVEKSKLYLQKYEPSVRFFSGNALKIKPPKKMDLIISNAMFQWFEDFEKALSIIEKSLSQGGILAFSSFTEQNFCEIKKLTGLSLDYLSSAQYEEILLKHNYEILFKYEFQKEINFNSPLELLAHLKLTGVNSLSKVPWTIKEVKTFCEEYSKTYSKTVLTYSPIIIIAKKR